MIEGEKTETIRDYWKKPGNKIAVITLFTVLAYTGIQGCQTRLIYDNNVVSQRAFISIGFKSGGINFSAATLGKKLTVAGISSALSSGGDIESVSFIADIANGGNTGTKNLTFFLKCVPSTERLQEPWVLLYQGVNNPAKTPQFIGPHASAQTTCGFSGDDIRAIAAGNRFGYIMVDVSYKDRLVEEWRKTQATATIAQVQWVPAVESSGTIGTAPSVTLVTYGQHNCADEECPTN